MRITSLLVAITTLVAGLLLMATPALAGGGGHGSATCHVTSDGPQLTMLDNCFEGIVHTAQEGATLTVVNDGELPHTITAVDGSFDSGRIASGGTFQIELDESGDIPIYCTLHGTMEGQGMAGLLQVEGPGSADLASTASPDGQSFPVSEGVAVMIGVAIGAVAQRLRSGRARLAERDPASSDAG